MMERITVVLGAGAALDLTPNGCVRPTTENITRSIVDNIPVGFDSQLKEQREVTILADIYTHLCSTYHVKTGLNPTAKGSAGKVHFEILFHVLELLDTYNRSKAKLTISEFVDPFSPFIQCTFSHNPFDFYRASKHLIQKVIEAVMVYDSHFGESKNNWYRRFWKDKRDQWDVFNFNYDTTIEQSLETFEDGYEPIPDEPNFERFNIHKLLDNVNGYSTINHIHGCITYGYSRYKDPNHDVYEYENNDIYKYSDAEKAKEIWLGMATSHKIAQNAQTIVQGPIITGLSKTDKITCLPYDIYRYNLMRSIVANKGLLVAGYSFGDKYVNNSLYRMSQCHGGKKRVVLIDFWNIKEFCEEEEGYIPQNDSMLSYFIFERYFTLGYGNNEMLLFIMRVAHHDHSIWKHFDKLSMTDPMVSDNGQLMLFIGGMKEALANHSKKIYDFLGL